MVDVDARLAEDAQALTAGLNAGWSLEAAEVETQKHGESVDAVWKERFAALDRLLAVLKEQAGQIERLQREATETVARGGVDLIAAERRRQVEAEGWTEDHDDAHALGELAEAAACYALPELEPTRWPWEGEAWKPSPDDRVRELVKAGALVAAEIDRLQRAASTTSELGSLPDSEFSVSEASRLLTERDAEVGALLAQCRIYDDLSVNAIKRCEALEAEVTQLRAERDAWRLIAGEALAGVVPPEQET